MSALLVAAQQLNLHRLGIFLTVVDSGGFSAAAKKLFMSQPSVSNHVRQLEQSLGATLLDRSGGRVRPTPQGDALAEYARRIFLLADEAVGALRQVAGLRSGRLVVGGTTTVGTYLLPQLVATFRERHETIDCDIFVGNGLQVEHYLLEGDVGIAVFAGTPNATQLECKPFLSESMVLITAASHRLAGTTVSPSELTAEHFLLREPGSLMRQQQEEALETWGISEVNRGEMWGPETVKQAVAAGLGVALVSEHAVAHEVSVGRLGLVDVDVPLPSRPVVYAYRRDRVLSPAERAFATMLDEVEDWPFLR